MFYDGFILPTGLCSQVECVWCMHICLRALRALSTNLLIWLIRCSSASQVIAGWGGWRWGHRSFPWHWRPLLERRTACRDAGLEWWTSVASCWCWSAVRCLRRRISPAGNSAEGRRWIPRCTRSAAIPTTGAAHCSWSPRPVYLSVQ